MMNVLCLWLSKLLGATRNISDNRHIVKAGASMLCCRESDAPLQAQRTYQIFGALDDA